MRTIIEERTRLIRSIQNGNVRVFLIMRSKNAAVFKSGTTASIVIVQNIQQSLRLGRHPVKGSQW